MAVADAAARSRIADIGLAAEGERRIAWVARHSPVLNRLARDRLSDEALRGKRVAVVEARRVGSGVTGQTTAHLTEILDTRYHVLERDFGGEGARRVAESSRATRIFRW